MTEEPNDTDKSLPMVEHLIELRDRLLRIVALTAILFAGMFPFANDIYTFVSEPLQAYLPESSTMIATEVASPFLTPFKLTLVLALFAAMPVILYQTWAFIAPGLYKKERLIVLPLFGSSVVLFYAGMAFAYYVVFPLVFGFFTSVGPENVTVMTDMSSYLDFVLKLFFAFGIAFEIPIATVVLIWTGVVTPQGLAGKRPYVIVGCFVIGMLLTPPDVISQALLAGPMWLLFEVGVFFGRLIYKAKSPEPEPQTDFGDDDPANGNSKNESTVDTNTAG
ncbi:MAG: twin-arginine translocase subunit TatC [Gammaproteobacteria bacterium]|nr:MAG: twin-arginine translocase subunit TatC [Gammaproteobacteria bacterium]RLA51699.1 MAG: twin-arginine translocase subunit TatC [Gammaproteobacteria bacterium]